MTFTTRRPSALGLTILLAATATLARTAPALADDAADQLKAQYDDAVAQLKAAQDRKSELSAENDRLTARVKELEAAVSAKEVEARVVASASADRMFFLRSHYAAWERFVAVRPEVAETWRTFLSVAAGDDPSPESPGEALDATIGRDWPIFTAFPAVPAATSRPTTGPTTKPTTGPTTMPTTVPTIGPAEGES